MPEETSEDWRPAERQLTYGEKYVGITFNPSNNQEVDRIKTISADFINEIELQKVARATMNGSVDEDVLELYKQAKIKMLEAQMLAVKAATWKF